MSALWNQAALHWRNYQTPKPRVMHAPVGKTREQLCDEAGLEPTHIHRASNYDGACVHCGYAICNCFSRDEPVLKLTAACSLWVAASASLPTAAETPRSGGSRWALELMRAGKTVRRIASGTTFQIANDGVGVRYRIAHAVRDVEIPSTTNFLHGWSDCLFEIVEERW